jgi:hypothetical protein
MERDDLTLCSAIMGELWTGQREMKMRMKWRIPADMGHQEYDWPDCVSKTSYRCKSTLD